MRLSRYPGILAMRNWRASIVAWQCGRKENQNNEENSSGKDSQSMQE